MKKDAEAHADEDRKRKELIEARNHGENTAYAAEKALRDFGDKVPADIKSEIETKVADVRNAVDGEDIEAMKSATEELGKLVQKIGASVYQTQEFRGDVPGAEAPQGGEADPSSGTSEDDVIDGEVKE